MGLIDDFLEYLKVVKKHSSLTIDNYKIDLYNFYEYTKGNFNINKEIINNYLNKLYEEKLSKSTISRKLSALRTFNKYLIDKGIIKENYFANFKNPKKDNHLPKYVKDNDIDKMFLVPDTTKPLGKRNLAIIKLLYATGLRVSELVNIKLKDINISDRTIRVFGKGSKERIVIFGYDAEDALKDYISNGRVFLDTKSSEYLFLNNDGNKLSDRYIRKILDDIIVKASIDFHVSPHMLRHTFATVMLNNGLDLVSVKNLLGHSSLNTTSIYTHVSVDQIKKVYNSAHPRAHT